MRLTAAAKAKERVTYRNSGVAVMAAAHTEGDAEMPNHIYSALSFIDNGMRDALLLVEQRDETYPTLPAPEPRPATARQRTPLAVRPLFLFSLCGAPANGSACLPRA